MKDQENKIVKSLGHLLKVEKQRIEEKGEFNALQQALIANKKLTELGLLRKKGYSLLSSSDPNYHRPIFHKRKS